MLFLLTGEIQSGKTRWLERLVARLAMEGTPCVGVIAPGVWQELDALCDGEAAADQVAFEKLGINNVLLPQKETIPFARRRDLVGAEAEVVAQAAEEANLGWAISDEAIVRVNQHFADADGIGFSKPALLIVDELGILELQRGQGLTEALRVLAAGPSLDRPHALVVVRRSLVDEAKERLVEAWHDVRVIEPTDAAMNFIADLFACDLAE